MTREAQGVGDILDQLEELAGKGDVSLGAVVEKLDSRSHGPFLMIAATIDSATTAPVAAIAAFGLAAAARRVADGGRDRAGGCSRRARPGAGRRGIGGRRLTRTLTR